MSEEKKVARISVPVKLMHLDGDGAAYCPHCGYGPLDGVNGVDVGKEEEVYAETGGKRQDANPPPPMLPTPGSPSVCCGCGGFLVFNDQLRQVVPTEEELAGWRADPELWAKLTLFSECLKRRSREIRSNRRPGEN